MTFTQFGLRKEILEAVEKLGFEQATPVQEQMIPAMLDDFTDLVGLAQTGTGKTAAFGLPMIQAIAGTPAVPAALILSPTRELCIQIAKDLESFSVKLPGVRILPVYGGSDIRQQIRSLKRGVHIIVATPGRLLDLINRGAADLSTIQTLVLDEGDEILNMGFKDELDAILETAPETRRTVMLSATMPNDAARIAAKYMKNPKEIRIGQKNSAAASVDHKYIPVRSRDKYEALKRIIDSEAEIRGLVFCRTRASARDTAEGLIKDGYNADALHGDLSQTQRDYVMNKFRQGHLKILTATDIAARGLDVSDITHVIHFDLPDEPEVYTHRSGRTGRAGRSGISWAIVNAKESHKINRIRKHAGIEVTKGSLPGASQILKNRLTHIVSRDADNLNPELLAMIRSTLPDLLKDRDPAELLYTLLGHKLSQLHEYYTDRPDEIREADHKSDRRGGRDSGRPARNGRRRERGNRARSGGGGTEPGYKAIQICLGRQDRVQPQQLIGLVNQSTRSRKVKIGRIDIQQKHSVIQVTEKEADKVCRAIDGFTYKGRRVTATRA